MVPINYKIGQHLTKCHIYKINNKHYTQSNQSTKWTISLKIRINICFYPGLTFPENKSIFI